MFARFFRLFGKECRQIAKSLTFWLFIALILLMYFSQMGTDVNSINNPVEPVAGQESYGSKTAENPETIMPLATQNLLSEYQSNSYVCYPLGFYKTVRLNGADQAKVAAVLGELTGREPASFGGASPAGDGSFTIGGDGDGQGLSIEGGEGKVTVQFPDGTASEYRAGEAPQEYQDALGENAPTPPPAGERVEVQVTYERFLELMAQVDGLIGGRSSYDRDSMVSQFGFVPKTYEDALTEYQNFTDKDGVFGAYARLFSDYLGIVLSILPAFVAASLFLRDRRARMQELVYTRRTSSATVIGARFAALAVLLLAPVLLLSLVPLFQLLPIWGGRDLPLDYLAFVKYTFAWLAPSVLVSASLGMLLTVLTDTPVAVLVQAVWWFFDINGSFGPQNSSVFQLAIRHNSLRRYEDFAANLGWITWNRIGYTLLALSLVALTVWLYEQKRRGKLNVGGKIHRLAAGFRGKHKARSSR